MQASDTAPPSPAAEGAELTDADIHAQLLRAIGDQRLQPGTRLREDELGRLFGVSRTRIRQVLIRLAQEDLVTLTPHRGASIARPSERDAHEVFEARRLIEPFLAERAMRANDPQLWRALEANIEAEESARQRGERHAAVHLSGEFHLLLAEGARHRTLAQTLRSLVLRSSLVLMSYGPGESGRPMAPSCRCEDHRALLASLRQGDARAMNDLLLAHLKSLDDSLCDPAQPPAPSALESLRPAVLQR